MSRTRALTLAAVTAGLLTLAPSAHAALTLTATSDAVVVNGDAGASSIQLHDGNTTGGENYAFSFYSESGEAVDVGDSGCVQDPAGVMSVYCGNSSFNKAVFNLGGGNDALGWYGDAVFSTLGSLTVDFGSGSDDNESGIKGIPTVLRGGDGADTLAGEDGPTSVVEGGPGSDQIVGGGGLSGETLRGGDGDDQIQGLGGNDQISGDAGNDTLVGSAGGDTINGGPGLDNVEGDGVPNAFSGNDTLQLQDGERDSASCGFGADAVAADAIDLLAAGDCESVTIAGGAPGGGTPPPPGGGTTPTGDAKVALAKPGKLSARKRRLGVEVSCPSDANGGCQGQVRFTVRFTERGKKRKLSLGRVSFTLQPGASKTVGRKLSKKIVRRLRKAKKLKLTVRAISRDAAFKEFTSTRTAPLKLGR